MEQRPRRRAAGGFGDGERARVRDTRGAKCDTDAAPWGAYTQVQLQTVPYFVSDVLRGDEQTELRVRLVKFLDEEAPPADD